jgi:exodeoxyribonuclease V alpha subunit
MDEKIKNIFDKLSKSKFRSSFHLKDKDILYIEDKGIDKIRNHAYDFVTKRLADTSNVTDGKQTPMKGHPVFIAQHATGTCCRRCLEKWHHISKNKNMTDDDIKYVVDIIMSWIEKEYNNYKKTT